MKMLDCVFSTWNRFPGVNYARWNHFRWKIVPDSCLEANSDFPIVFPLVNQPSGSLKMLENHENRGFGACITALNTLEMVKTSIKSMSTNMDLRETGWCKLIRSQTMVVEGRDSGNFAKIITFRLFWGSSPSSKRSCAIVKYPNQFTSSSFGSSY